MSRSRAAPAGDVAVPVPAGDAAPTADGVAASVIAGAAARMTEIDAAPTTDGAAAPALSARIRAEVLAPILSGEWPPGHRIPFEHELAARYGCSRMTVNKALSSLAEAGLIERRRRAGSFVAPPRGERAMLAVDDLAAEAARRGERYGHELLFRGREPARAETGAALRLRCLHRIGGAPVAHEDRLIMLDAAPGAATADFGAVPPGTWLLRGVPWTEAEHALSAHPAGAAMARLLQVPAGTACLVLERRTWNGEAAVTEARITHAGGRYRFVGRFRRNGA